MVEQISEYCSYERDGNVGIWYIEDMLAAIEDADINKGEQHYRLVAGSPLMKSTVIVLGSLDEVDDEVLYYVSDTWTEIEIGVKAVGYVTEDRSSGSVIQQLTEDGIDVDAVVEAFTDVDTATEWAKEQQRKFSDI